MMTPKPGEFATEIEDLGLKGTADVKAVRKAVQSSHRDIAIALHTGQEGRRLSARHLLGLAQAGDQRIHEVHGVAERLREDPLVATMGAGCSR